MFEGVKVEVERNLDQDGGFKVKVRRKKKLRKGR